MTDTKQQTTDGDQSPNVSAGGNVDIRYGNSDSPMKMVLTYFPRYLVDYGSAISGPKKFMAQKNTVSEETFRDSLLFLGVSTVLSIFATLPLVPDGTDLKIFIGSNAVAVVLIVSLFAVVLRLAWRLVGGKAGVRSFFVTYAYFAGVMMVVFVVFQLLGIGILKVFDYELYSQLNRANQESQPVPDIWGNSVFLASFAVRMAGLLIIGCWGFVTWGAYRELNELNKWRSFAAFILTGLFVLPVMAIVFLVNAAISGDTTIAA